VRRRKIGAKGLFTGWALLVYLFLYLPIVVVVIFAFNQPTSVPHGTSPCAVDPTRMGNVSVWNGFTSCWFSDALNNPTYVSALKTSIKIAVVNAVIATALGTCAALALARMNRRARVPFDVIVYLTLVVPEIVIAVASLVFFVQAHNNFAPFPTLSWRTILLAHVVFNASLVMLIVRARFVGMGKSLEEAGFDLGSGPFATFRQITLPRLMPAVIAGGLLSFTFSFDDYLLSAFLNGPDNTWPLVVFAAVRFGVTPAINAFASMMLLVTVTMIVATGIVLRRGRLQQAEDGGRGLGAAIGLG
jgi:ABC-type spermidine/putrescine transport system permease subunit II